MTSCSESSEKLAIAACFWRNGELTRGTLLLSSDVVSFVLPSGSPLGGVESFPLSSVREIEKYNTYLFVPNGLIFRLESGETLQFTLSDRPRILQYIRSWRSDL